MRAQFVAAFLFVSCATHVQVTGRYATSLSDNDVQQIKQLAAKAHVGLTVVTIDAVGHDRVHVEERRNNGEGYEASGFFVLRHGGTWRVDEKSEFTAQRQFLVY
jgi:hypothetical protein